MLVEPGAAGGRRCEPLAARAVDERPADAAAMPRSSSGPKAAGPRRVARRPARGRPARHAGHRTLRADAVPVAAISVLQFLWDQTVVASRTCVYSSGSSCDRPSYRHQLVCRAAFAVVCLWHRRARALRQHDGGRARKQARAARVASGSIRFDGRLDDEVWQTAVPVTDFMQAEPDEGARADRSDGVRFRLRRHRAVGRGADVASQAGRFRRR